MTNIEENKETKVIWQNPDASTQTRSPKSFRLPDGTLKTIERIAESKGMSQADVIVSAVHAYLLNFTSIAEKAKELQEVIDDQVNEIDYNKGDLMTDNEYKYRQMLFGWSEELDSFK